MKLTPPRVLAGLAFALASGLTLASGLAVASCSPAAAPARSETASSEEIDLTKPPSERADRPVFPPGLVPCPKDAPPGETSEGCAVRRAPVPPSAGADRASDVAAGTDPAGADPAGTDPAADTKRWDVPVGPDDPVRGPATARVTVVVFSDFECPFCRRHAETLERLRQDYPAEVRIVWKDLPLPSHPRARPAAELARAARREGGDAAFWRAHDLLFEAQAELGDPAFRRIAGALGLPPGPTLAGMRAARHGVVIQAGITLSDRVEVEATPTTFVNGRKLTGAQPYTALKEQVDAELATPAAPADAHGAPGLPADAPRP